MIRDCGVYGGNTGTGPGGKLVYFLFLVFHVYSTGRGYVMSRCCVVHTTVDNSTERYLPSTAVHIHAVP
jgi:hypothetical protein